MENEVKEPAPKYNYISPQEYLAIERAAEYKNEYYHGQILAMPSIDKGRKFFFYQQIPSLKEYTIIDSLKRFIQVARKQANDSWKFENMDETYTTLHIQTIDFQLPISEIYYDTGL